MGEHSKIQWTHHTFNPWRGCTKVSAGCEHCYAEAMSGRNPSSLGIWGKAGQRSVAAESYWKAPLKWDRDAAAAGERRRVFCASLADVFEGFDTMPSHSWDAVAEARARLFRLIDRTPNLDWLLLTKRPENIADFWHTRVHCDEAGREWGACKPTRKRFLRENVWLGTSVENQEVAEERIPHLLKCADLAKVLFLSCEPLLGPLDLGALGCGQMFDGEGARYYDSLGGRSFWGGTGDFGVSGPSIGWLIAGGESGPASRVCRREWVESLVRQCAYAGVPCFVKQVGANYADERNGVCGRFTRWPLDVLPGGPTARLNDPKGGDTEEWPEQLRVRQVPTA